MFLPEDYQSPVSGGAYLKIKDKDEFKLRIMSKPILGWEDWNDKTVMRFRLDKKPKASINAKKPMKHFWSMIVYNHTLADKEIEPIQIWHVTQASIRKELEKFVQDPDWGSPFTYDIKVSRKGSDMNDTEYFVVPLPHKPIPEQALIAFKDKPIWLEAMYDGQDPFAEWPDKTPLGVAEAKTADGIISKAQYDELMSYVYADDDYIKKLEENVKKHFGTTIKELPSTKYDALLKSVRLYAKEKMEKEAANHNNELPF